MKFLMTALLVLISTNVYANEVCTQNIDGLKIEMTISGIPKHLTRAPVQETFHLSYSGQSRNTYSAFYAEIAAIPTHLGFMKTLKKTRDESTWNDMPESLYLETLFSGPAYILDGLLLDGSTVEFSNSDCAPIN